MDLTIPLAVRVWSSDDWVQRCISESGKTFKELVQTDINQSVTSLGSSLLNIACICMARPSFDVSSEVVLWLLSQGANPNVPDQYGRTALTNLVTSSCSSLRTNPVIGLKLLGALFEHGADPDVLFTPDYVSLAGCKKWTLAHHMNNVHHGNLDKRLPKMLVKILYEKMSFSVADSEGRLTQKPGAQ